MSVSSAKQVEEGGVVSLVLWVWSAGCWAVCGLDQFFSLLPHKLQHLCHLPPVAAPLHLHHACQQSLQLCLAARDNAVLLVVNGQGMSIMGSIDGTQQGVLVCEQLGVSAIVWCVLKCKQTGLVSFQYPCPWSHSQTWEPD